MSRTAKIILALLILAAAASAAAILRPKAETVSPVARISRDGVVLEEIALNQVTERYTLVLEDDSGSNTILVEPGRICVVEADCPDQICVEQGFISDGTVPIVCLPHRLVIEIVGGGDDFDAAAG